MMEEGIEDAEIDSYIKKPNETADGDKADVNDDEGAAEEEEEEPQEYEVEKIVDVRKKGKKLEYRVKWKGYDSDADTWEPRENMQCDELLEAFEASEEGKRLVAKCAGPAASSAAGGRGRPSASGRKPPATSRSDSAAAGGNSSGRRGNNNAAKSSARASTPDFDDDDDEYREQRGGTTGNKRKVPVVDGSSRKSATVRRRYDDDDADGDDDLGRSSARGAAKGSRGANASYSTSNRASGNAANSSNVSHQTARLPTDHVTDAFLKNDASDEGKASSLIEDATDYDAPARISVAMTRKRNGVKNKDKSDAANKPRDYGIWKWRSVSDSAKRGLELEEITAIIVKGKFMLYLVQWQNSTDIDLIEHDFLLQFYPQMLCQFLLKRAEIQNETMLSVLRMQKERENGTLTKVNTTTSAETSNSRDDVYADAVEDLKEVENCLAEPNGTIADDDED